MVSLCMSGACMHKMSPSMRNSSPSSVAAFDRMPVLPGRRMQSRTAALGDDSKGSKTGITREEEPEEFWQSKAEAKGESPFKDPLAVIGIVAILFPFLILGVAIASGYLDLSPYQYPHH